MERETVDGERKRETCDCNKEEKNDDRIMKEGDSEAGRERGLTINLTINLTRGGTWRGV